MKQLLVIFTLFFLSGCATVAYPSNNAHPINASLSAYESITIGTIHFDRALKNATVLERQFSEKLKTKIYNNGMGDRHVKSPNSKTIIIRANITDFEYGQSNLRMLIPFAGQSKVAGTITLCTSKGQTLATLEGNAIGPVLGGYITGFVTADVLLNGLADETIKEVKRLIVGETNETPVYHR